MNTTKQITVITHPKLTWDNGLCDILLQLLEKHKTPKNLFNKTQIILSSEILASQLEQFIANKNHICSNYDLISPLNLVIQNIYLKHNKDAVFFDNKKLSICIFDALNTEELQNDADFTEIYKYLALGTNYAIERKWSLANDLAEIFNEYMYLRTSDLVNLNEKFLESWQIKLWQIILIEVGLQTTYLDIYKFFTSNPTLVDLPPQIYLFNLTSIYQSQLEILINISQHSDIYWFYQSITNKDYNDLLSEHTKTKIIQKYIKHPDLVINDLHLSQGNNLVANLAQSSREFIELLRSHEINIFNNEDLGLKHQFPTNSMLEIIQHDVANLVNRKNRLLNITTDEYWQPPLDNKIDNSIKTYVCHNKMREVQTVYQHILSSLEHDKTLTINDIVISAPDINQYSDCIRSVFNHEYVLNNQQKKIYLPYSIAGNSALNEQNILNNLLEILTIPAIIDSNKLLHILHLSSIIQNFGFSSNDIELICQWIIDNHYCEGINSTQLYDLGLPTATTGGNSLEDLLLRLSLGLSMCDDPMGISYDNVENSNLATLESLIEIINSLIMLSDNFYDNKGQHKAINYIKAIDICTKAINMLFKHCEDYEKLEELMTYIARFVTKNDITIKVIINLVNDFIEESSKRIYLTGNINCLSIKYAKTLEPRLHIVLGLNFNEYPRKKVDNQLNNIVKYWYLADSNRTNEDKQAFLELLMNCREQLVITYIGYSDINNTSIQPSNIVSLLQDTLLNSMSELQVENPDTLVSYKTDLIETKSDLSILNSSKYTGFWSEINSKSSSSYKYKCYPYDEVVTFNNYLKSPLKIKATDISNYYIYNNYNFSKTLGISTYFNKFELDTSTIDTALSKKLIEIAFRKLDKVENLDNPEIAYEMLHNKPIFAAKEIGRMQILQLVEYYKLYKSCYTKKHSYSLDIMLNKTQINISGELLFNNNQLVYLVYDYEEDISFEHRISGILSLCVALTLQDEHTLMINNNIIIYLVKSGDVQACQQEITLNTGTSAKSVLELLLQDYLNGFTSPSIIRELTDSKYISISDTIKLRKNMAESIKKDKLFSSLDNLDINYQDYPIFTRQIYNLSDILSKFKISNKIKVKLPL